MSRCIVKQSLSQPVGPVAVAAAPPSVVTLPSVGTVTAQVTPVSVSAAAVTPVSVAVTPVVVASVPVTTQSTPPVSEAATSTGRYRIDVVSPSSSCYFACLQFDKLSIHRLTQSQTFIAHTYVVGAMLSKTMFKT